MILVFSLMDLNLDFAVSKMLTSIKTETFKKRLVKNQPLSYKLMLDYPSDFHKIQSVWYKGMALTYS